MNLSDINVVKELLSANGFTFSKGLGQNFLVDDSVCPRLAQSAGLDENTAVIEIGAGIGVLTAQLAQRAGKVISFELDRRLLPVLARTLEGFDNIELVNADIMKADLFKLIEERCAGMRVCVCANLPYYITSPVIMLLLESRLPVESVTVMVQSEAAQRLCAQVGTRDGGAVTVAIAYYANAQRLFFVPRDSFLPAPKVDSEVIQLKIRKEPPVALTDEKMFFRVVKAAFAQRRKTAVNSVSATLGVPKEQIAQILTECNLDLNIRAERMTMQAFAAVSERLTAAK